MAPIPNQNSLSSALLTAVIVGSGIAIISILPIFIHGIRIYLLEVWSIMIKNRKDYLEWNRLRKEWNKMVPIEYRLRRISTQVLFQQVGKQGLSQEDFFYYNAMARVLQALRNILYLRVISRSILSIFPSGNGFHTVWC
jgi:hypothetical protein